MRNISFNRFDHRNGIIFDAVFLLRLILAERRREFLKDNVKGNIFLILAALVWGCSLVAQKAGLRYMDPFTFTAIRFLAGGLLMLPFVKAAERRKKERGEEGRQTGEGRRISRAVTIKGALVCGTAIASLNILQQYGLEYTTVGKGGFITALYILLTPLLGMLLGKKTGRNTWAGVAIGLAGMYMLCLFGGADRINPGDLLMLCASVACAVHLHAVDHFVGHMDPVKLSCYQFIAAGVISAVISVILYPQTPAEIWNAAADAAIPLLYASLFSCVLGYTFQTMGQKLTAPSVASLILSLETVFSLIAGMIFFHEVLAPHEYAGCALMFTAIIVSQLPDRRGINAVKNAK